MLNKVIVPTYYRTMTVYKVTGIIVNRTDDELIKFCDFAAFGGHVKRYGKYVAYVTVHID